MDFTAQHAGSFSTLTIFEGGGAVAGKTVTILDAPDKDIFCAHPEEIGKALIYATKLAHCFLS